jgi:hypothetical protein
MVGQGSQYALTFADANGQPLDGGRNYRLHLPPDTPCVPSRSPAFRDLLFCHRACFCHDLITRSHDGASTSVWHPT